MSVTLGSRNPRRSVALAPLVRRGKELAGIPAFRRAECRNTEAAEATRLEAERFSKLQKEWQEADAKRREEEENEAEDFWLTMILVSYFASMFRQNSQFQPEAIVML